MIWDDALIAKYDLSGPRYTSYPTAPQFDVNIDKVALITNMMAPSRAPLSLYFHIPFCANLCYYCACNKIVTKQYDKGSDYVELLGEEMRLRSLMLDNRREVTQLHFGGGTPTFLNTQHFRILFAHLHDNFNLQQDGRQDFSIEIDPREIDEDKLAELVSLGINRISLGVQDFDPKVQQSIHRVQSYDLVKALVNNARELGIQSINFDLIYGLPFQSVSGFKKTLDDVIRLSPDRISLFNYAHLPNRFRSQKRLPEEHLPPAKEKLAILKMSINYLLDSGYEYIGMDHFAKPQDALTKARDAGLLHRNFQGYTTHSGTDLLAFGVSGISNINGVYMQNLLELNAYKESIENGQLAIAKGYISNNDDRIRHDVIMTLLSQFQLSFDFIEKKHKIKFVEYFSDELARLEPILADNMVQYFSSQGRNGIRVTERGRLLIRCVCMVFDKHLNSAIQYSKVI
ncbi:oxygen-independent coproporphyrinogen III oxidase [Marinomonas sp. THO17]|uniref:oxygen-independent coproporphyrinogen III oxidase n=1 Tax=Marinomonas sp. THO17 TaxID=3149048 RepID=UPI00336BD061